MTEAASSFNGAADASAEAAYARLCAQLAPACSPASSHAGAPMTTARVGDAATTKTLARSSVVGACAYVMASWLLSMLRMHGCHVSLQERSGQRLRSVLQVKVAESTLTSCLSYLAPANVKLSVLQIGSSQRLGTTRGFGGSRHLARRRARVATCAMFALLASSAWCRLIKGRWLSAMRCSCSRLESGVTVSARRCAGQTEPNQGDVCNTCCRPSWRADCRRTKSASLLEPGFCDTPKLEGSVCGRAISGRYAETCEGAQLSDCASVQVTFLGGISMHDLFERYRGCCWSNASSQSAPQPGQDAVSSFPVHAKTFASLVRVGFPDVLLHVEFELKFCDPCVGFGNRLAAGGSEVCRCYALFVVGSYCCVCCHLSLLGKGRDEGAQAKDHCTPCIVHGGAAV